MNTVIEGENLCRIMNRIKEKQMHRPYDEHWAKCPWLSHDDLSEKELAEREAAENLAIDIAIEEEALERDEE